MEWTQTQMQSTHNHTSMHTEGPYYILHNIRLENHNNRMDPEHLVLTIKLKILQLLGLRQDVWETRSISRLKKFHIP